jgi:hypothetical protein
MKGEKEDIYNNIINQMGSLPPQHKWKNHIDKKDKPYKYIKGKLLRIHDMGIR